jgi:uncharacterized Fe-S cluster protein YjdI
MRTTTGLMLAGLATTIGGCKLADKFKVDQSYCEAVCEWAVECVDGESSLTAEEAMQRCIEATEADDPQCGGAEKDLEKDDVLLLNTCIDKQKEQSCDALTGNESAVMTGTPPVAQCLVAYGGGSDAIVEVATSLPDASAVTQLQDIQVYNTYNNARNAVLETGAEVCIRFEETFCDYAIECMESKTTDFGDIRDEVYAKCLDNVMGNITDECISNERYDSILPVDYNLARYSAEECMDEWDATASSEGACAVYTSTPPAICAGAFSSAEQVETVLNGVITLAGDYDIEL